MGSRGHVLYIVGTVGILLSLAVRLSVAATSIWPVSLSFSLSYTDAESSPFRVPDADPAADLPAAMPMRSFVAAGIAMRHRRDQLQHLRRCRGGTSFLRRSLSYKIDEPAIYITIPVGSPPQNLIFLVDTGSELTWTQCSPCQLCNDTGAPRFISRHSSSYLAVPCNSLLCAKSIGFDTRAVCSNSSNVISCVFTVGYGDKTVTAGAIAVDSFHLHPSLSSPFIFGCASIDIETVSTSSSGLVGLSPGPFSFNSQLFTRGGADMRSQPRSGDVALRRLAHKFAYCLTDRSTNASSPGTILFGDYKLAANLSYTKLVPPYGPLGDAYYFVGLEGITVGDSLIEVALETGGVRPGGTIVDSGTGFTQFVKGVYHKFVKALLKQTADLHPLWVTDSGTGISSRPASEDEIDDSSSLCYTTSVDAEHPPQVPLVTLHLAGMVDLELGPTSVLYPNRLDNGSVYFCLAFSSTDDTLNIIGNYQQQKYWVEYNLQTSSLGIAKAASCALDVV